jgi:hypothetical protein
VSLNDFADPKAASTDAAALPRFFGTGPSVTVKGDGLGAAGSLTPDAPGDARAAVKALKGAGVDARSDDPQPGRLRAGAFDVRGRR